MNNLYDKSYAFAVNIVKAYQTLSNQKHEYVLSKQILKSGTSIGANVAEAYGGTSNADFTAKLAIAYKESLETKFWLRLLKDTGYMETHISDRLHEDADELSRILYTIIKRYRKKSEKTFIEKLD